MALTSYSELQLAVMDWLARPNDPLISGAIPDMILMFEEDARDRLKTRFNEITGVVLNLVPLIDNTGQTLTDSSGEILLAQSTGPSFTATLPHDYWQARRIWYSDSNGNHDLIYQTPSNLDSLWPWQGAAVAYTIEGFSLRTVGQMDPDKPLNIDYMQGITSLSDTVASNWLLANYPSLYLFGTLMMAAAYIGDDPRLPLWLQGRENGYNRILLADRKARWPGGALAIQTDTGNP